MIPNDTVQAAFISKAKAASTITDLLTDGSLGVKEAQYQGSDYSYPAVRVRVVRQTPRPEIRQCDVARVIVSIRCYAEGGSSLTVDNLAGAVNNEFHRSKVAGGTDGVDAFYIPVLRVTNFGGAVRLTERLWRSEMQYEGNVWPSDEMGGS